ncbi:MAG TPA: ferrous iron transport protein A [Candidatus Avacidaminococcus intestinavium]|uniref:Ferrous iron transport protein A n=1 Tax=Candidatus Avacidaminococcus intestinavium TaxID=2840684 RepID=A0A9D1SM22_9FIRM|nr:ferrous iron transport protein A [Candidatus Avacidaminococcus intestinavium]
MIPATMLKAGRSVKIVRINGRDKTRTFLAGLGFTEGCELTVISEIDGNVIFKVKDARVALGKEMAMRILVG